MSNIAPPVSIQPHEHHHAHGAHGHSHAPASFGTAFMIGITLNLAFVAVETGFGFSANSVALLADAGHNLSDVFGLAIAWTAATLGRRRPSARYTYGLRRSSIMAALINAMVLLLAVGAIGLEAIGRLSAPEPVAGVTMMIVASVGIAINVMTASLFARGRKDDLNIRAAYIHMATDAAFSAGVVVVGFLVLRTGWLWLDTAASLAISVVILIGTWRLLAEAVGMSLDRVPANIEPSDVDAALAALPSVAAVRDLHIWSLSTTEVALTCHLVMPEAADDSFLSKAASMLHDRFRIVHPTIQVDRDYDRACALMSEHAH